MPTVLESVDNFRTHEAERGVAPDLLTSWSPNMETQINVHTADGELCGPEGKEFYSNGVDSWWPIRVPKGADGEAHFKDYKLDWPLDLYADAIGCTGWDWVNKRSRWVAFDFDTIVGHSAGVGISDAELDAVRERASALPYVTVRKSTGGAGLHLYVAVDEPTANHTEHAAFASAVLAKMSSDAGFNFAQHVDCAGGNMWIWRRDVVPGVGLSLIKAATEKLGDVPNWRDHVATPKAKSDVRTTAPNVDLDDKHRALLAKLDASPYVCNWLHDLNLAQTHTKGLEDEYKAGGIDGVFSTTSLGNDPATPNCWMYPMADGAWRVYRFGTPSEAPTWKTDDKNRTTCIFNRGESAPVTPSDAELRYPTLTMRGLLSSDFTETYIVEDVLIKGMPMIMGGAPKTLKTAQLLDLTYNLSIGGAYLGKFRCTKSRVLMLTGESGGSAIKRRIETFRRAYGGHVAADDHFLISESLPRLRSEKDLALLSALMQTHGTDVVAIDPAYLCMGDGEAGNVQSQGVPLLAISEVCRKLHATIIIAHHVTKGAARKVGEPIELTDLTQAGFAEWARQWWLIGRREEYEVGSGRHQFIVNVGNCSSYSAQWAIDINEGTRDAPCWEVELTPASEVKAINGARKLETQIEADAIAVKALLSCGPMAQSTLRGKAGINFKRWKTTLPTLLGRGLIKPTPGPKAGVTYYMLGGQ